MNFTFARFAGRASAERAVDKLLDRSIDPRQIRVMTANGASVQPIPLRREHGAHTLIIAGAVVGSLGGVFAGAMGAAELGQLSPIASGALGGAGLGAFLGALGSLGRWRLIPGFTDDSRTERGVVVGALTVPQRQETAREALLAADADRLHETDARVARSAAATVLDATPAAASA